mmetsp:Transcript_34347/g.75125  ORF Transcript_34347/g.75125 Transcript_34347/m.75125 type:complete len:263 (-) Transcript_34347:1057-1845(-)
MLASSGHVMGIISVDAFSFIVQDPRGIMEWQSDRSRSSRRFRYRSISCSLWYMLKMGCVRKEDSRANAADMASGTSTASDAAVKGTLPSGARKESSWSMSARVVVSSMAMDTWESSSTRRLHSPSPAAAATAAALPAPTCRVTVSKKGWEGAPWPSLAAPMARAEARPCTRAAICLSPSGPWYTAYMAEMLASSACAVQMLEVALSRRMCCSRVCMAMRSAGLPLASTLTPMMRPGSCRLYASDVDRNAACGPPYPMGTPKR